MCRCAVDMVSTAPRTTEEDCASGKRCTQNALPALFERKLRRFVSGPEKCLTRNCSLSNSAFLGRETSNEVSWTGAVLRARICFLTVRDMEHHAVGELTG